MVDFRGSLAMHTPYHIKDSAVKMVSNMKFLSADNLTWTLNTTTITRKAQQHLHFL